MNQIDFHKETRNYTEISDSDIETARVCLCITIENKSAAEMAVQYGFDSIQQQIMLELLSRENDTLWEQLLNNTPTGNDTIVSIAMAQIGNKGGEEYWSWYGFEEHVDWCACFVSWCLNECMIPEPRFSVCDDGINWFINNGSWYENDIKPKEGMIVFFDWNKDGQSDHVGIVKTVENDLVKTIERNSSDECKERSYMITSDLIVGYGDV